MTPRTIWFAVFLCLAGCSEKQPAETHSCAGVEAKVTQLKEQLEAVTIELRSCNSELAVVKTEAEEATLSEPAPLPPEIHQTCTMNGFGQGTCKFTNLGRGTGSLCGFLRLRLSDASLQRFIQSELKKIGHLSANLREIEGNKLLKEYGRDFSNEVLCSGNVEPDTTVNIQFSIPQARELCSGSAGGDWRTECVFEFVPKTK